MSTQPTASLSLLRLRDLKGINRALNIDTLEKDELEVTKKILM